MRAYRSTFGFLAVLAFAVLAPTALADPIPIPVTNSPNAGLVINFSFEPLPAKAGEFTFDVEIVSPGAHSPLAYAIFDGPDATGQLIENFFFFPLDGLPPGQYVVQTINIYPHSGMLDGSMSMSLFAFEEGFDYLAATATMHFYCSADTEAIPGELALTGATGRSLASQSRSSACPEPPTLAALLIGLGALGWSRRRAAA